MILGDSGPVIALFDQGDREHRSLREFFARTREDVQFPSHIVAEVAYMLWRKAGAAAEVRFLMSVAAGRVSLIHPGAGDYDRAAALVEQYADFPLGTVDALIVAMAERLKVTTILTLDRRHFGAIKPLHCESFTLVP
ncbi:MAG: type II toxin-antitoxin system VapC family toxin [Dehalococcoidia bacterium]